MTDVVLLGAGASADAGVATSFEMTDAIARGIRRASRRMSNRVDSDLVEAFDYVCDRLHASSSTAGSRYDLDVELVFSTVELLAERESLEVTPFVAAWQSDVDQWRRRSRSNDVFASLAKRMLNELRHEISVTRKEIGYLMPLVVAASNPAQLRIATLNYDRSIELAGEACNIGVHTGIWEWVRAGRWTWPTTGMCLLKLHGSIDWAWCDDPPYDGRMPSRFVREIPTSASADSEPVLVFGLRGKLRAEGPFLSALAEFESWLSSAQRLTVVGYSFRDDHVNQIIRRWTHDHRSREIILVDPGFPRRRPTVTSTSTFRDSLLTHLKPSGTSEGPETKIKPIRKRAAQAVPDLFAPAQAARSLRSR
jgi:hypothetical protein